MFQNNIVLGVEIELINREMDIGLFCHNKNTLIFMNSQKEWYPNIINTFNI